MCSMFYVYVYVLKTQGDIFYTFVSVHFRLVMTTIFEEKYVISKIFHL